MDLNALARVATQEALKGLSDADLLALADAVAEATGRELVKQGERETALERRLAEELDDDYRGDLDPAVDAEVATLAAEGLTPDEVAVALDGVDARMRERDTGRTLAILTGATVALGLLARGGIRERVARPGGGPAGPGRPGVTITGTFDQADRNAISALGQQQLWWIGDFWSNHLSRTILATVTREALTMGLGRDQVGRIMRGVIQGTVPAARVPGTFRGSTSEYFRMLSSTVRNRASAWGALSGIRDAGFTTYRIDAVMDARTTEVCREMHGREFRVQDGEASILAVTEAETPDAVKDAVGWKTPEEVRQAASREGGLEAAGLALPPYHANCRTVVVPV